MSTGDHTHPSPSPELDESSHGVRAETAGIEELQAYASQSALEPSVDLLAALTQAERLHEQGAEPQQQAIQSLLHDASERDPQNSAIYEALLQELERVLTRLKMLETRDHLASYAGSAQPPDAVSLGDVYGGSPAPRKDGRRNRVNARSNHEPRLGLGAHGGRDRVIESPVLAAR